MTDAQLYAMLGMVNARLEDAIDQFKKENPGMCETETGELGFKFTTCDEMGRFEDLQVEIGRMMEALK